MKSITLKLYEFDELAEEIKKYVIKENRYALVDDPYWSEVTKWNCDDKLKELGYQNNKVLFSGFGSQGDGACFTSDGIDIDTYLKTHNIADQFPLIAKDPYNIIAKITHNYRYFFSTSTTVSVEQNEYSDNPALAEEIERLQKHIEQDREKLGDEFYKLLGEEYESQTSDEAILDWIRSNEYTFEADGTMRNENE